jgi:WD40 repeat protein
VQFNPDGNSILSAGDDNTNILWNARDGSITRKFTLGTGRPSFRIQFLDNGSRFWSWERAGSSNTVIQLFWATDRASPLWTSQVKNFSDFRPQDMTYAFSANDSNAEVTVWNATNSTEQPARTLSTTKFGVPTSRVFSPNGSIAVIAFADQGAGSTDLVQWDYTSNTTTSLFTLQGLDPSEAMTFNPDGSLLAIGFGKFIILYDIASQREVRSLAAHTDIVTSLKFSPDGHYLLSRSLDNNIRLWDVTESDPAEVQQIVAHTANSFIFEPGISPDNMSAYAAVNLSMFSWNTSDTQQNSRVDVLDHIYGVAYSSVQPYALTVLRATSQIWDMSVKPTARLVTNLGSANDRNSGAAAFSADGQSVVIDGSKLALRDLHNHVLISFDKSRIPSDSQIVSLAFSPDGRYLVGAVARTYRSDQTPDPNEAAQNVIAWDMVTGTVVRSFGADLHNRRLNHVTISPNSRFVLTSSNDGTLILWDIETGHLVTRLAGHTGTVNMAVFTPDSRYVISASEDTTLIQWDVQTGQLLRRFIGHNAPVKYVAMSQDGKTFISSSGNDTIIIWQLIDIASTISWTLNNRYIRALTCDEGRQYGLQSACDPTTGLLVAVDAALPSNIQTGNSGSTATLSPFDIRPTPTLGQCFVTAVRTDVGVYVGPARNRVIRFNLTPNRLVLVTGQITLANGDIWWRVAVPDAAAGEQNRYWVAKADIQESGDCDRVPTIAL